MYGTSLGGCLEPEISIVLAAAGVEFFFIDTEHSTTTYPQIQGLCRTARGAGLIPLVRVTQNEPSLISRALDVGAMGIIVPRVHSAAEARAAMDALKFPPLGHRGYGLGTIVTDLKGNSAQEEVDSANRETMAVMMIESQEGVRAGMATHWRKESLPGQPWRNSWARWMDVPEAGVEPCISMNPRWAFWDRMAWFLRVS